MTAEQEAQEKAIDVYGADINKFGAQRDGFVKAYLAGSTIRSNEAKDFAEWIFDEYIESYTTNQKIKTVEQLFEIYKDKNP